LNPAHGYRVVIAVALLLAASSVFLSALLFTRLADTTARTNNADVQRRAHDGEAFLRDHPQGIPGIPVGTLRQSVNGQQRTVRALSALDCTLRQPH
jgi:hypothetical protein